MRTGRERAAQAVAARVAELGLTQAELGIDPSTYRAFIRGETWPWPRTLATLETRLGWEIHTITRMAAENNGAGEDASVLAGMTDNEDEREMLRSKDITDGAKRRLIARLWAQETLQQKPDDPAESGTSQSS